MAYGEYGMYYIQEDQNVYIGCNAGISMEKEKMEIGDKVKPHSGGAHNGVEGIISRRHETHGAWYVSFGSPFSIEEGYYESNLTLIAKKNKTMNITEKFTTMFLAEPEKSFRKAGITNGDGYLTSDGQKVFLTWLLKKNGDAFKTDVVDVLLKEMEDEK